MLRSIDRPYSDGVMEKRFLNAALKVRIVEKPACPAISVMLRVDCFNSLAASSSRCMLSISQKPVEKHCRNR